MKETFLANPPGRGTTVVDPAAHRVAADAPGQHVDGAVPDRAGGGGVRGRGGRAGLPGPHDGGLGLLRDEPAVPVGAARPLAQLPLRRRPRDRGRAPRPRRPQQQPQLEPALAVSAEDDGRVSLDLFPLPWAGPFAPDGVVVQHLGQGKRKIERKT